MRPGEMLANRYRLDDRIDGGAMGDVWRGHDTRLDRVVAIKLLHAGLSGNATFRTRFQQEARAVAALQAPNVVSLYDYGEEETSEGTVSYLIMEMVKGRSLANILTERGTIGAADTLHIIAAAADGLQAAHQAGLVHRDVKPGNMLIDDRGNVKLVDFGIARARGEAGLTETGMVMGTVAYSSPEQLYDQNLTGAADLYSLGVVAYECLAGRPPFGSSNPGAVINGHLHQAPPPLPQNVPQPVCDLVERSLAKDPNRRWRSAEEMAQAFRDVATGGRSTAVMAPQVPPPPPPADATRRMPAAAAAAVRPPVEPRPPRGWETGATPQPEEPRKSNTGMIVLGVITVLVVLVAIGVVWTMNDTSQTTADDGATTAAEDATPDEESEPAEDEQSTEPGSDDDGSDEESQIKSVPSLQGKTSEEAIALLNDRGFYHYEYTYDITQGATCRITDQNPPANTEAGPDTTIQYTIAGEQTACENGGVGGDDGTGGGEGPGGEGPGNDTGGGNQNP